MSIFSWLMKWFKSKCNGGWEHYYVGVKIETLDNPGWSIEIELSDTDLEDKHFEKINIDNGDDDWFVCWVEKNKFNGAGDPDKLEKIIEIFRDWVESVT